MNQINNCKTKFSKKILFFKILKILPKTFNLVWRKNKNKKIAKYQQKFISIYMV